MLSFRSYLIEYAAKVASANLQSFRYNEDTEELTVWFRSGGVYLYHDVPADVVEEMRFAESRGRYFWRYIRLSYPYTQLRAARKGFSNAHNTEPSSQPQRHLLRVPAHAPFKG